MGPESQTSVGISDVAMVEVVSPSTNEVSVTLGSMKTYGVIPSSTALFSASWVVITASTEAIMLSTVCSSNDPGSTVSTVRCSSSGLGFRKIRSSVVSSSASRVTSPTKSIGGTPSSSSIFSRDRIGWLSTISSSGYLCTGGAAGGKKSPSQPQQE